ncbi:TPA: hypothetical protein DHW58_00560 [Patescibacteria group bacterium]|nr:hypothetical protein [Patescibacteria group bacterium]
MNYSEYIVLDVETTGVDARVDDVIEFAAVRLDAKGEVIDQLDFLIGTQQPISSTVMALTGIRPEDLSGQPEISTVIDKIRDFVGTAPIVGHNIGFDVEFLNAKGAELKNPVLDTLELAYTILPAQSYYSLEFLSHRFGFAHQPAHRAMADVLATTDLFRYLVGQVADLQATTRKQIISLVPADKWTWGWLVNEPPTFSRLTTHQIDEGESDQLAAEVKRGKAWAEEVLQAATDPINLVETHFAIAGDALALACAVVSAPAIVIVPDRLLYRINWAKLSQTVGAKVVPRYPSSLQYRTDAEVDLANSQESLSALEAQLITKVVIWRIEWGMDYSQLYLSREEQYQWEQKLAPVTPLDEPTDAVVVAAAGNLMDIGSFQNRVVVTARPLMMEDAAFADQSRIFSVNYFTAAISSRRDFVHQYVRGSDVKLADSLFKTLNHLSGSFQTITQSLVEIYTAHPPTSVYERNIELASEWLPASLSEALREAAGHVQK